MAEPGLVIAAPGVANIRSNHCVLRHGRTWPGDISQPLGLPKSDRTTGIAMPAWPGDISQPLGLPKSDRTTGMAMPACRGDIFPWGIANIGYNHCVTSWPGLVISALGVAKLCEWGGIKGFTLHIVLALAGTSRSMIAVEDRDSVILTKGSSMKAK